MRFAWNSHGVMPGPKDPFTPSPMPPIPQPSPPSPIPPPSGPLPPKPPGPSRQGLE